MTTAAPVPPIDVIDVIDVLLDASPGDPIDAIRTSRPEVKASAQRAYDALFATTGDFGFPLAERFVLAGFVALLLRDERATTFYLDGAAAHGADAAVIAAVERVGAAEASHGPYGVYVEEALVPENDPGPDLHLAASSAELLGARLTAALGYVQTVVLHPRDGRPERLQALLDAGFDSNQISILTQEVSFLNFQLRTVSGLRTLKGVAK